MSNTEKKRPEFGHLILFLLPILLIGIGIGGFLYFKSREVKVERKPAKKYAVAVETIVMKPGDYQSSIRVMGSVIPDREVVLKAKVAGEVVWVSSEFVQGGLMKKGQTLLKLEDSDYQVQLKKARSSLDKALSDLDIEKGSQIIAKEELRLIKEASIEEIEATDLALRKPQLIQAEAAVEVAKADFEQARLNLERTKIKLPFDALILERTVNIGSLVSSQGALATLVDVGAYRIEALVPPDKLSVIKISETSGSKVVIYSQYSKQTWYGKVVRSTGKMAVDSRMAGLIILVPDPLGLKRNDQNAPLLLGDHVEIKILGEIFSNVYSLSRGYVRDGNTVWVYNNGKLEIRQVDIAWKEDGVVFVRSGINKGDRVVTTELPSPVNGMALQQSVGVDK